MSNFDALIFDIDGTLWNASPASAKGWNLGLKKLGLDLRVTPAQIEKVSGRPFGHCLDILLPGLRGKIPELFDTLNQSETEAVNSEGGRFYEGTLTGIRQLAERYGIFLVSNCQKWYLELFLQFSNLGSDLAGFDCHGLSGQSKGTMLSRMKDAQALKNPVYIGDTAEDEMAAQAAGMAFIRAAWGFGKPRGRPFTVHTMKELVQLLSG